jgi:hypothetical protein
MKRLYNVSYDLNKTGKDYKGLHEELKKTGTWIHLLDSTWLLFTAESATQIYNRLRPHIDQDDNIMIAQITNNYSGWLPENAWNWVKQCIGQPA